MSLRIQALCWLFFAALLSAAAAEDFERLHPGYADDLPPEVAAAPRHLCRLVNAVERTHLPLIPMRSDPQEQHGFGVRAKLNQSTASLLLDTGASGMLIGRRIAQRAGARALRELSLGGVGGYSAVLDRIRIGELEFEDCLVKVADSDTVTGIDGVIGADVFASYLVEIDGPARTMRLSPLPAPPEETAHRVMLRTVSEKSEPEVVPSSRSYVAPEMAHWSKALRIRHHLLVPVEVNGQPMLFGVDTGASHSMISTTAARKVTRLVRADFSVKGVSGSVNELFAAERVRLRFGSFDRQIGNMLSFDLARISHDDGIDISGLLGFEILQQIDLKIDYRDNLVELGYDDRRIPSWMH